MTAYRAVDIDVPNGPLRVGIWDSDDVAGGADASTTVLAIHGVTASHISWAPVAELLTSARGLRLVAPDLRGRGRSASLPGPWGMATHARDLAAVLERLGSADAVVLGHSMGGFVGVVFASLYPSLTSALVLVDGGLPLALPGGPVPNDLTPEEALRAALGPAAERLSLTFESTASYREFWRAHPAFGPNWCEAVENYVDYDLVGTPPRLRSSVSYDALAADTVELSDPAPIIAAWQELNVPTLFLRAPLGLLAQPPGLYPREQLEEWTEAHDLTWSEVPDVNHYTIVLGASGADAVASAVRTLT